MFRENVLVNEEIIQRIATTMVPIALDYEKIQDAQSPEARFLRPLMKQRNQEQGVWIFAPDGKALGGFIGFGDMVGKTKGALDSSLKAFGPVTPRKAAAANTHPHRGLGVRPDGSVCVAEYVRRTRGGLGNHAKAPVISSVTLSEKEFKALAPARPVAGARWEIPAEVAKRFSRLTSPLCYQHAPQPGWVKTARLAAEVRSVEGGTASIGYEGALASTHVGGGGKTISEQEVKLTGEGVYDVKTGKMRSVLIVGSGTVRWPEAPDKPASFDALAEWSLEAPTTAR